MKLEWHRTPIRKSCSACGKEIQPTELRIVFTDVILNKKGNIHFYSNVDKDGNPLKHDVVDIKILNWSDLDSPVLILEGGAAKWIKLTATFPEKIPKEGTTKVSTLYLDVVGGGRIKCHLKNLLEPGGIFRNKR